jgi:hydrogenase expression/formation protein HypE
MYPKNVKLIAVRPNADADRVLEAVRAHAPGRNAAIMKSLVRGKRVVTMLAGEQLPRIC